jgi:phospholipid/cholesterol/gamma-HCH transport system substrate-binding protein
MRNTLETRLGIFFALALVVAVIVLELIGTADFFRPGYSVTARFKNAQELKPGDQVKIAGVDVGTVEDVVLENGLAKVSMKINSKYEIKTDARAVIKFTGLMGQNFVSIEGGTEGAPTVLPGAALETYEQPDLSVLMAKLENVATGVEGLTKSFSTDNLSGLLGPLTDFVKQNSGPLTLMIGNMKTVSDSLAQGRGTMGKILMDDALYTSAFAAVTNLQSASGDLKGLLDETDSLVKQARLVLDEVNAGRGTLGKLSRDETLYTEATAMMRNLREISDKINRGQGSVGQLVNDDTFLKNAKLSLQKLDKATEGLEDQGPLSVLGIAINSLF